MLEQQTKKQVPEIVKKFGAVALGLTIIPSMGALIGCTAGSFLALDASSLISMLGYQDPGKHAFNNLLEFGAVGGALVGAGWAIHSSNMDEAFFNMGKNAAKKMLRKIFGAPKPA